MSASSWKKQSSRLKTGSMNLVNNDTIYGENATFNHLECKFAYVSDLSSTTASFTTISAETAYLDSAYVNDLYITNLGQNNIPNDRWLNVDASNGIYVIDLSSSGNYTSIGGHSLMKQKTAWGSTAIGYDAMRNISTRTDLSFSNTAVGTSAMYGSDLVNGITGIKNAALGNNALSSITTGSNNSAFGYNSLSSNTTGVSNTAAGNSSMNLNTTGMYNVGVGVNSLMTNSIGSYNSVCGSCSMTMNVTGCNNVACGHYSLGFNTTGCNNAAIGYNSMFKNVDASANTAIGASSLYSNINGMNNVAIGYNALYSDVSGSFNTVVGAYSDVTNTMLNRNQILGYNNKSAYSNVNIIGTDISASGPSKTFISNVADSSSSLISNVVMYDPVTKEMSYDSRMLHKVAADASGYTGLIIGDASQNTCIGGVLCMTEGNAFHSSTAKTFGMISIVPTFLRIGKIISPYPATDAYLDFNDTGGSAIYGSDFFNINPPICNINSTAINIVGKTQFSSDVSFNATLQSSGFILSSVSSGGSKYRARNTTISVNPLVNYVDFGINNTEAYLWNASNTPTLFATNNIERMRITNDGYIGIGTGNPTYPLDINRYVSRDVSGYLFNSSGAIGYYDASNLKISINVVDGLIRADQYIAFSDKRIKNNIVDIDDEKALSILRQIKPKTYDYVDKLQRGTDSVIGFIAQEIKEIIPKAVTIVKDYVPTFYTNCHVAATDASNIVLVTSPIDLSWNPLHDTSGNAFMDAAGNACSDASGNKCFNVKLYDQSNNEIKCKTTAILDKRSFLMDTKINKDGEYFLHGQEVDDFHNLDKNAIFTVVTAAVQDIDRIQQAQQASQTQMLETQRQMQETQTQTQAQQQADAVKIESLKTQLSQQKTQNEALTTLNTTLTSRVDTLTTQVASLMSDMTTLKQMFNL
jgi:hypothetical protein